MCPKSVENAVFHVFHKQGFHIPVIRSEFNFMLFILKGEILVNSEEYAGTTVKTGEFVLQPITAKIEILAMIDTECIYYRFNQPELFCDKRYHHIMNDIPGPLINTPLKIVPARNSKDSPAHSANPLINLHPSHSGEKPIIGGS